MNATDYAHLHFAYHDDPALSLIADTLDDEYKSGWLIWLYWPRMISVAKSARSFGWFRFTPRKLAASIHDNLTDAGGWSARERMYNMLIEADTVRLREGEVSSPSAQVDLLLVRYPQWQKLSNAEKSKLTRERQKVAAGRPVDWTVRHLDEFAFTPLEQVTPTPEGNAVTANGTSVTSNDTTDTENGGRETTRYDTRRDETKEGARSRALPPSVIETISLVRQIPGLSQWQLESNVLKAMQQFPSLPDEAVCEAITAFEANVPEGAALKSGQAWMKLRNCFVVAKRRIDENSGPAVTSDQRTAAVLADMAKHRHLLNPAGDPA